MSKSIWKVRCGEKSRTYDKFYATREEAIKYAMKQVYTLLADPNSYGERNGEYLFSSDFELVLESVIVFDASDANYEADFISDDDEEEEEEEEDETAQVDVYMIEKEE